MTATVAVLGYHRIGPPPPGSWETWFSIPADTFEAQLGVLEDGGWEPIAARTFLRGLDEPESLPPRSVLLTFDDGFRSLTGAATDCLAGRPAVLFVPTRFVGGTNTWDENSAEPQEPICDWDDLTELEHRGISVESHGVTHRPFSTLSSQEVDHEAVESKAELERMLAKRVSLFAYPYGDAGRAELSIERAGYRAAFLYDGSPFRLPVSRRYRLARVPMGADTDLEAELVGVERRVAS